VTVVRRRHNSRYASLPNAIWEDPRISVEAKGVLGYLLSRPHDWYVRTEQVGNSLNIGKDKLGRIFRELVEAGYVTREQTRDAVTRSFSGMEYVVRDEPVASLPQPGNPAPAEPDPANPALYKRMSLQKTDSTKDAADDARARQPGKSLISPEAFALSDEVLRLQRIDQHDPRCIGTAYAVQGWLAKGWRADVIRQAIETVMARLAKPPRSLRYFEQAIADAHTERDRRLPVGNTPNTLNGNVHGTPRSQSGVVAAAKRLAEQFEGQPSNGVTSDPVALLGLPAR
jgi:hypothetical protein